MASRARRDIRRNLLLILLALMALGGLIAFVGLVQGGEVPVVMPQERTAFLERRAKIADNGLTNLTEAATQLNSLGPVPKCEDLLRTGQLNLQRSTNPQNPLDAAAFLGRFLGADTICPNDDPRFKEYMDKTELVLTPVQAALAKPFIFHTRSSIAMEARQADDLEPVRGLIRHLTALALYRSAVTGDTARAVGILQETIAVCQGFATSGSYDLNVGDPHHGGPPGREGFFKAGLGFIAGVPWMAIPVVAKYAADRNEPLDALLEMTRPALETPPDRSAMLLAYCMMLDDVMTGADSPASRRFDQRLWTAITGRFARRDARILVEQDAAVREAVNGPLQEYRDKMRAIAGEGGLFGPKFMTLQNELMNVTSVLEGRRIVAGVAVRLEAFRKEHGAYPEKLEELVPQYLSKIPAHPLSGEPLAYTRQPLGYAISDKGAPNTSDMRRMRFRENFSIDMLVPPPVAAPPVPAPVPPPTPPPPPN